MATKSFTNNTFELNNSNALKFHNIMNNKKKVKIVKVENHKTVTDRNEIRRLFGIK